MDVAIRAVNISKRYRLGERMPDQMLRESLMLGLNNILNRSTRKTPREIWALRDASFEVERGAAMGIIGRNGAGKSTLLKVLARITEPTRGRAEIRGRVGSLLEVGTGFHPELTGRENVFLNGAILGMKRSEIVHKFDEIVGFADVESFVDTPVKRYSSGMQMRLAFAVAAHLEPEILLVDEVLAVGDAEFQARCLGKMGEVTQGGRTVIFVSHNMGAVVKLCGRVLHLEGGVVVDDGEPSEVVANYLAGVSSSFASSDGYADLREAGRKTGTKDAPELIYAELIGVDGKRCSVFSYGDPLVLRVGIKGRIGRQVTLGVTIQDRLDQIVLHLHSPDDSEPFALPDSENVLTVTVPSIFFNDGPYRASIMMGDSMRTLFHGVDSAISFEVSSQHLGQFSAKGLFRQKAEWGITPRRESIIS
jgi:lipopolysaccharide transport system ATP-binding protein